MTVRKKHTAACTVFSGNLNPKVCKQFLLLKSAIFAIFSTLFWTCLFGIVRSSFLKPFASSKVFQIEHLLKYHIYYGGHSKSDKLGR